MSQPRVLWVDYYAGVITATNEAGRSDLYVEADPEWLDRLRFLATTGAVTTQEDIDAIERLEAVLKAIAAERGDSKEPSAKGALGLGSIPIRRGPPLAQKADRAGVVQADAVGVHGVVPLSGEEKSHD